jgi:DNA-directed RNA polymerase subunit RPC12/RpoP
MEDFYYNAILNAPAADVAEVKHGKWIYSAETINTMSGYFCSACKGAIWNAPYVPQAFRHCPNCGAKMDLKEGVKK